MSTSLLRVVERARREPEGRFHSLAHLIEVPALERAFHRLRADAAVGVDGVSKEQYGQALEGILRSLTNLVELAAEGEAVPASAVATSAHPQGRRTDAADRDIGGRGQDSPGGATRGAGGGVRARFSGMLVWLPAWTRVPTMRFVR